MAESNIDKFTPTPSWMREWYDKMNAELFGGALGDCDFGVFTSGKGSQGRTLGWFKITAKGLKANRNSRAMFVETQYDVTFVTKSNFVATCKPRIELNGNYIGTQDSWLNVLVHEMCHYYTYMDGYAPVRGHGPEFYSIGEKVCNRSGGKFIITRLASAETMSGLELNDKTKQSNQLRKERKISRMMIYSIILKKSGKDPRRWGITTSENVIKEVRSTHDIMGNALYIGTCNDSDLVDYIVGKGYSKAFRSYRYYILDDDKLNEFLKYDWKKRNPDGAATLAEAVGMENKDDSQQGEDEVLQYKIVRDGEGYNLLDTSSSHAKTFAKPVDMIAYDKNKGVYKFTKGKFTYEGMPGKWQKIEESVVGSKHLGREALRTMVREAVEGYLNKKSMNNEDCVEITQDMNLGLYSPFEIG